MRHAVGDVAVADYLPSLMVSLSLFCFCSCAFYDFVTLVDMHTKLYIG